MNITPLICGLSVLSVSILSLYYSWVGFTSSDDFYYVSSGLGWLYEFPYVPKHFGTIRSAVAMPIAMVVAILGESEFSVTLSTCLFLIATALLTLVMLSKVVGYVGAALISSILVTIPLFSIHSTIPCADLPELFYVLASFWTFWIASKKEKRLWLLWFSGALAAFAFSAHELTVGLLMFYGLLYIMGFGIKRNEYWLMALGFLGVITIECIYYWVMTGDALYRFNLLLHGASLQDRVEVKPFQISDSGVLHIWTPIDPIVMFFTCHYFSLLGFLILPVFFGVFKEGWSNKSEALVLVRLLLCLGIVWFLLVSIELRNIKLLPRYYLVSAYCFYIASAIWLYIKVWPVRKKSTIVGVLMFFILNMGLIAMNNKNPRFGERALVDYLAHSTGSIYTDPLTAHNAEFFIRWASQDASRVIGAPPKAGDLFFYNPKNADNPNRFVTSDELRFYKIDTQWAKIWEKEVPLKAIAVLLDKTGVLNVLPQALVNKVKGPNASVFVFKLP